MEFLSRNCSKLGEKSQMKDEELLKDCLSMQWEFLEWLHDSGCLNKKGRKLYDDYWSKFVRA